LIGTVPASIIIVVASGKMTKELFLFGKKGSETQHGGSM
jgi:hypothetical protein